MVEYTISGGHEETGELVWIKVASTYAPGWWSMNFTTRSPDGATVLSLSLDPSNTNVTFGDGNITIYGAAPQCTFDIDRQDSDGASGSFDCKGLTALMATDPIDEIDFSGTFHGST